MGRPLDLCGRGLQVKRTGDSNSLRILYDIIAWQRHSLFLRFGEYGVKHKYDYLLALCRFSQVVGGI